MPPLNIEREAPPMQLGTVTAFIRCGLICRVLEAGVPAQQPQFRTVPFVFPPAGRNSTEHSSWSPATRLSQDTIAGGLLLRLMLSR